MKVKYRKGFESPCKIRGFLSTDYWIFVGSVSAEVILLFLSFRTGITSGNWNNIILFALIGIIGLPLLYYKLKQKARLKKFDEQKISLYISNLEISKKLIKHSRHEIK